MKTRREKQYFLLYKPFGVLCQFSDKEGRKTLSAFGPFPKDVYPVGRLDTDSEGLVLLTNDGDLIHRLLEPKFMHPRTYLVQVEHLPTEGDLDSLRTGVRIGGRPSLPADVQLLSAAPDLPARPVPIRYRKNVPTAWLSMTLREGRNHQVRRMTAAVGHPTLRLVRVAIGPWTIAGLAPGDKRELRTSEVRQLFPSPNGRRTNPAATGRLGKQRH